MSEQEKKNQEDLQELRKNLQEEYVEIPDSLKPDQVQKMLEGRKKKAQKRFRWKASYSFVAMAACFCIVLGVTVVTRQLHNGQAQTDSIYNHDGNENIVASKGTDSDTESDIQKDVEKVDQIATAEDYDEIYSYVKAVADSTTDTDELTLFSYSGNASSEKSSEAMESADYSDTNVREEGVGEGDIVKSDGKYLYIVTGNDIQIVDVQNVDMEERATISVDGEKTISDIYVEKGKLYVFYSSYRTEERVGDEKVAEDSGDITTDDDSIYTGSDANTVSRNYAGVLKYDLADPERPKEESTLEQSGSYYSMRVVDGYLYLFSQFNIDIWNMEGKNQADYIPKVQGNYVESKDIYMPDYKQGNQYLVVTAVTLKNPEKVIDSKAVFSQGGLDYVSTKNIYLCDSVYGSDQGYTKTSIRKLSFDKGKLLGVGQTMVWGTLNDSFSIDEYKGNVRMVTTVDTTGGWMPWVISKDTGDSSDDNGEQDAVPDTSNALYILDENLEVLGKLEGLAADESVYSARFIENNGYFVTYRQTDPLFSVDLSDSKNPKVLDYLKIPGFSEYLHPYTDGRLLGIGQDTDESGTTNGVKLSMFNISDPANVQEEQKEILSDVSSTDVAYDYKSVLIDSEKNLIGFSAYGDAQHYYIYNYDEKNGFTCKLDRKVANGYGTLRGVYVGETLFLIEGNAIESYSMDSFEKIDDLVL